LTRLVDEHTEYFKSHLDNLPPLERKVFVALADLWQPSTAREVAEVARIDVNKASAYLKRLISKGAVVEVDKKGRRKWYQLSERMYNIYHLMRRRGEPSGRVRALVDFMIHFYPDEELAQTAATIAAEACALPSELRFDHYQFLEGILTSPKTERYREKIIREMPKRFFESPDLPESFRKIEVFDKYIQPTPQEAPTKEEIQAARPRNLEDSMAWVRLAYALIIEEENRSEDVERACIEAIRLDSDNIQAWRTLGLLLYQTKRYKEAEQVYRKAIEIDPSFKWAWVNLGSLLQDNLKRYKEAEQAYRKVIEIDPTDAIIWSRLGSLLHNNLQRYEEAELAYRKAIEIDPELLLAWGNLGFLLHYNLQRYEEAEQAYRKAIEIAPTYQFSWTSLIKLQMDATLKPDAALKTAEEFLESSGRSTESLNNLAWLFLKCGWDAYFEHAEAWSREAVRNEPGKPECQHTFASILGALGKWDKALEINLLFLGSEGILEQKGGEGTDFFIKAAASG